MEEGVGARLISTLAVGFRLIAAGWLIIYNMMGACTVGVEYRLSKLAVYRG